MNSDSVNAVEPVPQALARLAQAAQNVLYVSGEESGEQVALRARRLQLDVGRMQLLAEINDPLLRANVLNLCVSLVESDQHLADGESFVLACAIEQWGLPPRQAA